MLGQRRLQLSSSSRKKLSPLFASHGAFSSARHNSTVSGGYIGSNEDELVQHLSRGDVRGAYGIAISLMRSASADAGIEDPMVLLPSFGTVTGFNRARPPQAKDLSNVPEALHPLFVRHAWTSGSAFLPREGMKNTPTANAAAAKGFAPHYTIIESNIARGLLDTLLARKMWAEAYTFLLAYVNQLSLHDRGLLARKRGRRAAATTLEAPFRDESSASTRPSDLLCLSGVAEEAIVAFCDAASSAASQADLRSSIPLSLPSAFVRELDRDTLACFRRLGFSASLFARNLGDTSSSLHNSGGLTLRKDRESRLLMFHERDHANGITVGESHQHATSSESLSSASKVVKEDGEKEAIRGGTTSLNLQPKELACLLLRTLPLSYGILAPRRAYTALVHSLLKDDGSGVSSELLKLRSLSPGIADQGHATPGPPPAQRDLHESSRPWILASLLLQGLVNVHGNHKTGWRRVIDTSMLEKRKGLLFSVSGGVKGDRPTTVASSFWDLDSMTSPLLPLISSFVTFSAASSSRLPSQQHETSGRALLSPSFAALRLLRSATVHEMNNGLHGRTGERPNKL